MNKHTDGPSDLFLDIISDQQWRALPQEHKDFCAKANLKRQDFTCNKCPGLVWKEPCPLAWDFYNTDGDCLMEK